MGCGGSLWFSWPVCFHCHLPCSQKLQVELIWLDTAATNVPWICGREGGWGLTGLGIYSIYSFFLFSGFSFIEYRSFRLESFSWLLVICLLRILLPGRCREDGVSMFLHLWNPLWVLECCHPLHHFSAPDPGLSLNVYPDYYFCLFSFPSRSSPPALHWNFISWGWGKSLIGSDSCLCRFLACFPCLPNKPTTFRYLNAWSSQMCFCVGHRIDHLSYSCPSYCNFKERDLEVLLHCNVADIIDPDNEFLKFLVDRTLCIVFHCGGFSGIFSKRYCMLLSTIFLNVYLTIYNFFLK